MTKKYKLLSGEEINLETLRKHEIEHIESLEECINNCTNHDRTDYFYVHDKAFEPTNRIGGKQRKRLINSPFYKVVRDMVTKYLHKCSSGKE